VYFGALSNTVISLCIAEKGDSMSPTPCDVCHVTAGAIVPAAMVAANGFIDCTQWPGAISFMTVGLSFCGFQYNGFLVNHLDLAPPFAGLLMGMGNAIGTTARFWQRYFHGIITSTSEVANNYKST